MRFRDVISTAIANSFRSKLRTSLTVIAIFIGAFTLSITSAIGVGVSDYINTQLASFGSKDTMTVSMPVETSSVVGQDDGPAHYDPDAATGGDFGDFGGVPMDDEDIAAIGQIDGIIGVNPEVSVLVSYIQYDGGDKFQLQVIAGAGPSEPDLAAGEPLATTGDAKQLLLPSAYLEALDLGTASDAVGQTVTLGITDYLGEVHESRAEIAGVLNESLFVRGATLGSSLTDELVDLQTTGRPAAINEGYFVATATIDPKSTPEQISAIKADLAEAGFLGQTLDDAIGIIQTVVGGIIGVLNAFAVIALIAAGFGIVNTLLMSVQERTREIGLMKAMGMSGGKVFALFSTEAVFIGFLGSALGAAVAIALGTLVSAIVSSTVLAALEGLQIMQFAPASIAVIILVVMGIAFLAGTLPARRAASQNPIDALRYE